MRLLMHACCGPCSTAVLERLKKTYDEMTIFFYNPNIHPKEEHDLRLAEARKVYAHFDIPVIVGSYDAQAWFEETKENADDKEGEKRCQLCYEYRLRKTFEYAKKQKFDMVTTTISVSPHHLATVINRIGEALSQEFNIPFLAEDFKKNDGYLRSVQLAKELGLYRQDYCGCGYSKLDGVMRQNL